ncbi:MAG TPA: large conductance mechanosensitive channel protein MscL [Candidatus Binataceae bacterium]
MIPLATLLRGRARVAAAELKPPGGIVMSILSEFKEFAVKGNLIDISVGFVLGAAFGKISSSLVGDILMPPIGLVLGRVDFANLFVNLSGKSYQTLAQAKVAGAATLNYGAFINTLIDFAIVAFAMFLLVKWVNRLALAKPAPPSTKLCPYCLNAIPIGATKCGHCTAEQKAA